MKEYAASIDAIFMETSALTGENVDSLFEAIGVCFYFSERKWKSGGQKKIDTQQ